MSHKSEIDLNYSLPKKPQPNQPLKQQKPLTHALVASIPAATNTYITGTGFFPTAISSPFMSALREAFCIGVSLYFIAAICSALRGKKYIHGQTN
ncbi:MAG: hypothetical protein ABSA75_03280 [Candidatus Bathyarchaeia archaeon]